MGVAIWGVGRLMWGEEGDSCVVHRSRFICGGVRGTRSGLGLEGGSFLIYEVEKMGDCVRKGVC